MILTVDVGAGTQDIVLFKENTNPENSTKFILPSPTRMRAKEIEEATRTGQPIYLRGHVMGGGAITFALKKHLSKGIKAYAEEKPALTFSDRIENVKSWGVIIDEPCNTCREIILKDVDENLISGLLNLAGEEIPETMLIAVQDHGFSPYKSNREFRFEKFVEILRKDSSLASLLFSEKTLPGSFNRMSAIYEYLKGDIHVMDTVFSAMLGASTEINRFPALVINFGNSHTVFGIIDEDFRIHSLLEHHTSILKRKNLKDTISRFISGKTTWKEIFEDGGHGCVIFDVVEPEEIVVCGPNTDIFFSSGLEGRKVYPSGDIMISGNVGLLAGYLLKKGKDLEEFF